MKLKVWRTLRAFTLKNRTMDVEVTQKHRGKGKVLKRPKGKISGVCMGVLGWGGADCNFTTKS